MASPDSLELLEPKDRAEWRAWLVVHHATSRGVRLAIGKKGNPVTALTYEDAVEEALCFGWIDSMARRLDEHRYTGVMTPRRPGSAWAKSNKERVARLSAAGLMMPAGQTAVDRAQADGSWDILTDADDLIEPDDLSRELRAHPGARAGFDSLTVSARRMALFWIASAKRPGTRARRIAETVSAAAEGRAPR
jgi:uncharacterized protein YdeI (YjbR/CyaY-like superfamily)